MVSPGIKNVLVTGAGGLIGSESAKFYLQAGADVDGIDNNMRSYFFGPKGDTRGNIEHLRDWQRFRNFNVDIRDSDDVLRHMREHGPYDLVIHTAAQPSHDWAAKEPFTDFAVNAIGTMNLLEAFRQHSPKGVFIFTSTNKVYGDNPNNPDIVDLVETPTRYDYAPGSRWENGIDESMSLDHCTHSVFGASKVAADVMAQEFGRYFKLNVGVFRGGCLTGPQHSAVELHGFLTYIIDCAAKGREYTIFGYKGKQVRDQIHSADVVLAFDRFAQDPRQGEAYNLGGMKGNAASVGEVIGILEDDFGLKLNYSYNHTNRIGDHICYYTDMKKFQSHYPGWTTTRSLRDIIAEIVTARK